MSRSRSRGCRAEAGFGLVEVMVAMALFAFVAVASAPFFVGALSSSASARLNLQAKALGQERIERLRNLPFHVGRQNGAYIDLLDTYFRDLNTTTLGPGGPSDVCSARRFVATASTYECTVTSLGSGFSRFSQVVRLQFLDSSRNVIVPTSTYDSQTAGRDSPASNMVGVEVETRWTEGSKLRRFPVRTQISNEGLDEVYLRANLQASALRVQGNLADGDILELRGGLVGADASLTTGSRVALGATPGRIGTASGVNLTGAALSLTAPPNATGSSPSDSDSKRYGGTCDLACFGPTSVTGDQSVTISNGLPKASSSGTPVTASLGRVAELADHGFAYSNVDPSLINTILGLTGPIVTARGGTGQVATGRAYLDGTGSGATSLRVSATVSVPRVTINPTSFAPDGVVQLELTSASMTCSSGGGSGSVATSWAGKVRWMTPTGYQEVELKPGGDPLPDPGTILVRTGEFLDTYVSAWSVATDPSAALLSATKTAQGELAGVVTVLTANTRAGDNTSPITVTLGSLSCLAEDNR